MVTSTILDEVSSEALCKHTLRSLPKYWIQGEAALYYILLARIDTELSTIQESPVLKGSFIVCTRSY
jgi:hypothetical protein